MGLAKRVGLIIVGISIFSAGQLMFAFPNQITSGGITGFSTLLYYVWGWNTGIVNFLMNVPLFIVAYRLSRSLFWQSLGTMMLFSFLIGVLQPFSPYVAVPNPWIASTLGGFVMGLGLGLVAQANSSIGGGTLIARMLFLKFGFRVSVWTMYLDSSIYPVMLFVLGPKQTFFSLLLTICSTVGMLTMEAIWKSRQTAVSAKTSGVVVGKH